MENASCLILSSISSGTMVHRALNATIFSGLSLRVSVGKVAVLPLDLINATPIRERVLNSSSITSFLTVLASSKALAVEIGIVSHTRVIISFGEK